MDAFSNAIRVKRCGPYNWAWTAVTLHPDGSPFILAVDTEVGEEEAIAAARVRLSEETSTTDVTVDNPKEGE